MGDRRTECPRCGADMTKPVLIDSRYEVQAELGRGAMGVVYLARDVGLNRSVAVKLIAPEYAGNARIVAYIQREARALATIRSNHVVQVYASGPHKDSYFFAMEFIQGRSLETIINDHRRHGTYVPMYRALTILRQIAHGLGAVHGAGIVHRDVKPANIVIEENTGRPVLVDFGLAVPADAHAEAAGTPTVMAPEQGRMVDGGIVTIRTDIYSLGCTAYKLLTGHLPFESKNMVELLRAHMMEEVRPVSSWRPDLAPFDRVFSRALAKDPDERYASCEDLAIALDQAGSQWMPHEGASSGAGGSASSQGDARRGVRVLIVDDDDMFRVFAARAVTLAFQDFPARVTGAGSGLDALTSALHNPPNLVVLDYDMPGLDGINTLSRLRVLPGGLEARILVVSARAKDQERWRFSVLGVQDFLAKPVELQDLVDTLARIARRSGWQSAPDVSQSGTLPSGQPSPTPFPSPLPTPRRIIRSG
jgi:serine/threonine-protein kinase